MTETNSCLFANNGQELAPMLLDVVPELASDPDLTNVSDERMGELLDTKLCPLASDDDETFRCNLTIGSVSRYMVAGATGRIMDLREADQIIRSQVPLICLYRAFGPR